MLGEKAAEPVEAVFPAGPPFFDPPLRASQRVGLDRAGAHAADLLGADEPTRLEHLHVLYDGRERHVQRPRQLADRRRPAGQPVDHQAAAGIGEGLEDPVEWGALVKHLLECSSRSSQSQAIT